MKISTGFITGSRYQGDLLTYVRESVAYHKAAGFHALDFSTPILVRYPGPWQEVVELALSCAQEEGIRFEVCHLPFDTAISTDHSLLPAFCERMYMCIDAAAMLGVDAAVLHPNAITLPMEDYDGERELQTVLGHLEPFAEYAQKLGVTLALENMRVVYGKTPVHRFCQDPEELCQVADTLGIGVCWDFGHANTAKLKQSEALAYVGKRLKAVHINDNNGIGDDHVPVFSGTVDWKDAMTGLKQTGFTGPLNYELGTCRLPPALHDSFANHMIETAKVLESYLN